MGTTKTASARYDARRLPALGSLGMLELHILPLGQGLVPVRLNGGEMYEYILAAVGRDDKTVSLGIVEPFYSTRLHAPSLFSYPHTRRHRCFRQQHKHPT